jgi:hypothetical protein
LDPTVVWLNVDVDRSADIGIVSLSHALLDERVRFISTSDTLIPGMWGKEVDSFSEGCRSMLETPFPNVPMYDGDDDLLVLGSRESTGTGGAKIAEMLLSTSNMASASAPVYSRSAIDSTEWTEHIPISTSCQSGFSDMKTHLIPG